MVGATNRSMAAMFRCVVMQEGAPSLGWRSTTLDHVLRDAGRSDLEAELEQFAMDSRRSPQRIFRAHPPDQRAQFRIDLRSASKRAGFPRPVPAEGGPMHQEQAVPIRELDATAHPPLQHNQLMSECRVLCLKSALRLEQRGEQGHEEAEQRDLAANV
jgi:hypothetical protein